MARFGLALIAFGVLVLGAAAVRFAWVAAFEPDSNDPLAGLLTAAVAWAGLALIGGGSFAFAKARGVRTPPV